MRVHPRTDRNQAEIVAAAREEGATVEILSSAGGGCPDLLLGICGFNLLWEIKDGEKSPSRQRLTPEEAKWHKEWQGQVTTVTSVEQARRWLQWLKRSFE
jgi:hypothetical protein